MVKWTVVACLVGASAGSVRADDLPWTFGARVGYIRVASTAGNTGGYAPEDQGAAGEVAVYGDHRLGKYFRIGVSLPARLNGPGPTSNEYDYSIAARLVADFPASPTVRPFLALEPGVALARLPQSVNWFGPSLDATAGVRVDVAQALSVVLEGVFAATSFSGDVNNLPNGKSASGDVRTAYLGGAVGAELRF